MEAEHSSTPIDARGRIEAALTDVAQAPRGSAGLLVLADTVADAERLLAAGATHFLVRPTSDAEIALAARAAAGGRPDRRMPLPAGALAPLHRWLSGRLRAGQPCAVVAVALSRLDLVNAAHGRAATDAAIASAAARIAAAAGPHAIVVRAAGDRFLLGVEDGDPGGLVGALARALEVGDTRVLLGSRIGVAEAQAGDVADALIARAADALDDARARGGAVLQVSDGEGGIAPDRLAIDLHHAVAAGEIGVLFQPQVEVASGRIVGVEALARWTHATLGPLGADALFAAADRADLGVALSDHIQQLTLARAAAWPRALSALRLSLNLTAADVGRAGFARTFLDRVDASGFPRGRLTVEVTETGMIQELDRAAAVLADLRGAGCRVAIDDFGTGYSSLAYLKALPLDYLKLDKALVVDIAGNPRDRVVVRGVIDIARALGIAVVAEGVETPQQLALLTAEGCDYFQGFLTAAPIDVAALTTLMEEGR